MNSEIIYQRKSAVDLLFANNGKLVHMYSKKILKYKNKGYDDIISHELAMKDTKKYYDRKMNKIDLKYLKRYRKKLN